MLYPTALAVPRVRFAADEHTTKGVMAIREFFARP